MDKLKLAYLAGMIDGDGFISIARCLKMNNGRCKPSIYHTLKIGIAGTNRSPHDLARSIFGGNVKKYIPKKDGHQPNFQWTASGPTAEKAIKAILPYLIVKQKQAIIGIAFQMAIYRHRNEQHLEQKPPYRITDEMRKERDDLWKEIAALNHPRNYGRNKAGRELDGRTHDDLPWVK